MKHLKNIAGVNTLEFCEYIITCFVGVAIGFLSYKAFPQYRGQLFWVLISILLSITHDNNSKVAFDRMKGNIVGSAVGLVSFLLHNPPNLLTICLGVTATITLCFYLKLIEVSRTALVAFIIVVLYEEEGGWEVAAYRMTSVIAGCLIGLVINYVFRKITGKIFRSAAATDNTQTDYKDKIDGGE
jgi:uncharacterized membrane protein YgaE (UPF0421/DUF939 family)